MINSTPSHWTNGSGAAANLTTLVSNMTVMKQIEETIEKTFIKKFEQSQALVQETIETTFAKEFQATHTMMNGSWNLLLDNLLARNQEMEDMRQTAINQKEKLMEIKDVAKMFGTTKTTIHNHMTRGWLKGYKVGKKRYFTAEDIEEYKRMSGYNPEN
ncbi:MAG: DNA-binding protein [Sphingobacteriaceae bacterium]|nr:MAG: DNA-binding protein [Sphingobacteriaceae bacterium]